MTSRKPRLTGGAALVLASLLSLLGPGAGFGDTPGLVLTQAGIHFLLPHGFELSSTEVRGHDGPVEVVLFEPRDGVVDGQPNSGFIAISVHRYGITPEAALERLLADLSVTFASAGGLTLTDVAVSLAGLPRPGVRLEFALAGVAMQGQLAAYRDQGMTVVAYVQGQSEELAALSDTFDDILASVGVGSAPAPTRPHVPETDGTGLGTGADRP